VQLSDIDHEGGANIVSLRQARRNIREFGASDRRFLGNVRPPFPEELPDFDEDSGM
jgi:cysteine-rich CPCC protein